MVHNRASIVAVWWLMCDVNSGHQQKLPVVFTYSAVVVDSVQKKLCLKCVSYTVLIPLEMLKKEFTSMLSLISMKRKKEWAEFVRGTRANWKSAGRSLRSVFIEGFSYCYGNFQEKDSCKSIAKKR